MTDRETETFSPYEPADESYDWDYDDTKPKGQKILWGRVVLLGVLLLLFFIIGRVSAPNGASEEELTELKAQVEELEEENADLQSALTEPSVTPETTPSAETSPDDTASEEPPEEEGETYTVKSGDTLRGIAQTFCGDASLDDVIMDANGITDPTDLSVGQELTIPADCGE